MRHTSPLLFAALSGACLVAYADISVRETAEGGIVLSNLDDPAPPVLPLRLKASALGRRDSPAPPRADAFIPLVRAAAEAHGLPAALLRALIEVESGFDPLAVSPKGALGLTQLMPQTARALQVADPRDPGANIDGGARYLKELLLRHDNNVALALAAYNAGDAAVRRAGGIPPYPETRAYVPRVLARYHQLQSSGP